MFMPNQVYTTTTTTQGTVPNMNYQSINNQYPQELQDLINNATGMNQNLNNSE
jgi:hypothetical protein